jgi:hypothetical protein
MTFYRAAKLSKLFTPTFKHVKGLRGVKTHTVDSPTVLPFTEEKNIMDNIKLMEKQGFRPLQKIKFWRPCIGTLMKMA